MVISHYAVAFAAKRLAPPASLGTLFLACGLADLAWPVLLLAGAGSAATRHAAGPFSSLAYQSSPWTHSLLACLAWAVALGVVYRLLRRNSRVALVVAAVALLRWPLDALVARKDLPLLPTAEATFGAGDWISAPIAFALQSTLFAAAVVIYLRFTRARDWAGEAGFWVLVAFLGAAYLGTAFGPPPPSLALLEATGIAGWLIVAWGYWIDRHRGVRPRHQGA